MKIEGTTALVTGGASGLGAATARALAGLGARTAILDVDQDRTNAAAQEIGALGLMADVRDPAAVGAALDRLENELGPVGILVQCAGIATGARIVSREGETDIESFRRTVEINLIGAYTVMSRAVQGMMTRAPGDDGERGVVVNTSSVAAEDGQLGQCAYAASKAGVAALSLPAARELGRAGIRVMTIAPGLFDTPMMHGLPDDLRDRLATLPAFPKRLGQAAEYADLALHIIGNRMLNGTTIRLDAGVRLEPR